MPLRPVHSEEVVCIICRKVYIRMTRKKYVRNARQWRGMNTITCSKICSRKWNYLSSAQRAKLKENYDGENPTDKEK